MHSKPLVETHQELLTEALDIARCLRKRGDSAKDAFYHRRQQRLKTLHDELGSLRRHPIRQQVQLPESIPTAVRRAFVRAALLTKRYYQLAGHQWQGTISSPTLSKQIPDKIPLALESDTAIVSLCQHFQLSNQDQRQLTDTLQQIEQRIAEQATTIQAVLRSVGLTTIQDETATQLSRIQAAVLFKHLFGITLPAHLVDIVYTPLQIYFCLTTDQSEAFAEISATDQQRLTQLLESMQTFSFDQFRRFPTFGPCQPQNIDITWATLIAQQLDKSVDHVIEALSSSVSILPTHKAEAFLIHDIWGHYWQLMMTQFEADYAVLAHCDEPLRVGETAYTENGPVTCRELFSPTDDEVALNEEKAQVFFHGEVQQRLGLVFTHLIGEMMADVAEFKYVWCNPEFTDELPSSSVFKTTPVKLDLSLIDLDFLFIRVINPLLKINISALETSPLEQGILSNWKDRGIKSPSLELQAHLKQKLSRLHEIFLENYRQHYLSSLKSSQGIFCQAATNLVYLQNTINHLCVDVCQEVITGVANGPAEPPPYHDLLMIFIGCYCSGDSYSNFWQMDAVLADHFLPCWHLLYDWIQQTDVTPDTMLSDRKNPHAR
ncbi:hypothetical protein N836_06190 [Leptolyngbya sp. Heron Island J]|uniref:hypothetical protein n=1 Tax=Leptolyngbya sp. Heron Island J TaxID=1385935 RepID=UPI0003B9AA8B|nr:hypothetical protein [Leptolyngbya sp. Heron Island J]ESA36827.1 hypothetical protein N836_06190 [Leptolyngbya sp. Heron Island J]